MSDSPQTKKGFMPIRINRSGMSAHIPYAVNQISFNTKERLVNFVEKEIIKEEKFELDYDNDPTKPAVLRRVLDK